jgi:hypothetical protein
MSIHELSTERHRFRRDPETVSRDRERLIHEHLSVRATIHDDELIEIACWDHENKCVYVTAINRTTGAKLTLWGGENTYRTTRKRAIEQVKGGSNG